MSTEGNNIRNNDLNDVYKTIHSLRFIKPEPFSTYKTNTTDRVYDAAIRDNINDLNNNSQIFNIQSSLIDSNSTTIGDDIIEYDKYNEILKSIKYQTIDNEGNLLFNNIDIEPTKIDAMMKDSLGNRIQQSNFFIAGTVIITSLFFGDRKSVV